MQRVFQFLNEHDVEYKRNVKLSEISSIRIGGASFAVVYPKSEEELTLLVSFLYENKIKYKIVGSMTNILASDDGFSGVIISTRALCSLSVCGVLADCGVGISVSALISELARSALSGIESLYGIPGTLGGLVHNNGGANGTDISSALLSVRAFSPDEKRILILDRADMKLGYRTSVFFEKNYVILSALLAFSNSDCGEILRKIRDVAKKRRALQPLSYPSLGSIFKRQGNVAVSQLIDMAGLKGKRIGGAEISKKHAGFIINRGGATSQDVRMLIDLVKNEIFEKYGFIPQEEIEFLI